MEILAEILRYIVLVIGVTGIGIILIGVVKGAIQFILGKSFWEIRLNLVKHILLGLDFLIARDIIETVIWKTEKTLWVDLAVLILIITVRVIFSFFTSKEMKEIKGEHSFHKL